MDEEEYYDDEALTRSSHTFKNTECSMKLKIITGLTFTILVMLIGAVAAITGHALSEISKLIKTEVEVLHNRQQMIETLTAMFQQQSAQTDSTLKAKIRDITFCGGAPGWKRVVHLHMGDPSQSCPSGLALKYYSPGLRSCGRATNNTGGCWSTFFNTGGSQYSRVCGRVRGYQFGATDAFVPRSPGIHNSYVEGVSLTHGNRSHIWTFAAGLTESTSGGFDFAKCPCTTSSATQPPTFVGNDYFCESGLHDAWIPSMHSSKFFNEPLWDGQNCLGSCCQVNNSPYFFKNLTAPTTDNIELRVCVNNLAISGDIPIDQLELYVQ